MTIAVNNTTGPRFRLGLPLVIDRMILTAHLLTGSLHVAESVTTEAIASWNIEEETGEVLFQNVLEAAARARVPSYARNSNMQDGSYLADELHAVLRLAPELRRCYVLRILVGLSLKQCGRMLGLDPDHVDQYARAARQQLSTVFVAPEVQYAAA